MTILELQRRMRQLGEIRIGHVVPTQSGKTRPAKLDKFRFTSPSQDILAAVASKYGGEVKPWTPANGGPSEYEVYTDVNRLPIIIPPRSVDQWYELYQGSRCVRRCNGQVELKSDTACMCDPERRTCSITTRVNVMLRDVPPIGYWLLTTRGYYAATELPPVAEMLEQTKGNIPGFLGVEERRIVRDKPDGDGVETVRFMVPVLDIELSPEQLLPGASAAAAVTAAPQRQAIESGEQAGQTPAAAGESTPPPHVQAYLDRANAASTPDEVLAIWREAKDAGHMGDALHAALGEIGRAKREQVPAVDTGAPATPTDAPASDDGDAIWQQILAAAGKQGMTLDRLTQHFASRNGGTPPGEASAGELEVYLNELRTGEVAA